MSAPRIGCVRYLNALPLMYGYEGAVTYEHPSRLAALLEQGAFDVALVPAFKLFSRPGWRVVDGVAIACNGPVYSVFMAYNGPLQALRRVSLDSASLSSANLLRCILAEYHGLHPQFGAEGEARLLIGNQAIAFRQAHGDQFQYLDLGEEWKLRTGLPFVFALWLMRPGYEPALELAEQLRALKQAGVAQIGNIAAKEENPEFVRRYLSENIRYELGPEEKRALELYGSLLRKHGLTEEAALDWSYV